MSEGAHRHKSQKKCQRGLDPGTQGKSGKLTRRLLRLGSAHHDAFALRVSIPLVVMAGDIFTIFLHEVNQN